MTPSHPLTSVNSHVKITKKSLLEIVESIDGANAVGERRALLRSAELAIKCYERVEMILDRLEQEASDTRRDLEQGIVREHPLGLNTASSIVAEHARLDMALRQVRSIATLAEVNLYRYCDM